MYGILQTLDELLQMGEPGAEVRDLIGGRLVRAARRRRRHRLFPRRAAVHLTNPVHHAPGLAVHFGIPDSTALLMRTPSFRRGSRESCGVKSDSLSDVMSVPKFHRTTSPAHVN